MTLDPKAWDHREWDRRVFLDTVMRLHTATPDTATDSPPTAMDQGMRLGTGSTRVTVDTLLGCTMILATDRDRVREEASRLQCPALSRLIPLLLAIFPKENRLLPAMGR